MTYEICTAENISLENMHQAMCDAFSDYDIPMQPNFEQFCNMLKTRQFSPYLSTLAMENGVVQSLWLIGKRSNRGHLALSGTRPTARKQGLAKRLAKMSEDLMRAADISSIEFEVLTTNHKAISLYEKTGHKQNRLLDCYEFDRPLSTPLQGISIHSTPFKKIADKVANFKDHAPSWQASDTAIITAGEKILCNTAQHNGHLIGFLAANAKGSILQLAVSKEFRRKGIATLLLSTFAQQYDLEKFSYVNIDHSDKATIALAQKFNGKRFAQQIELVKDL